jgi:beta-lactamase superfamily II metal-dependent hydrolase
MRKLVSDIKSYSVGNGDMFYINHNSQNFTIIDCCLSDEWEEEVFEEISRLCRGKEISRFVSTHPDDDHIRGLDRLDDRIKIQNFYCVSNETTKPNDTDSFTHYCELRDSGKAFHVSKGCNRKWMNLTDDVRGSSGITVHWPDPQNEDYKAALQDAKDGWCPNNVSIILSYSLQQGATALWMGDLETAFMETIEGKLSLPLVDILFAPHHGRDSGRIPGSLLEKMSPRFIVVGEAPSHHLCYYPGYHTITQNRAGDILFECVTNAVHVFTSKKYESGFLEDLGQSRVGYYYAGTLDLNVPR